MDLHDALHDLHDDWRRAVAERTAGDLVTAARRRRALARTGYGAVGAGAAAAIVVGALALGGARTSPTPPAMTTSSAAPSPAPTAGPSTEPWPAARSVDAVPACGDVPPVPTSPDDAALRLTVEAPDGAVLADHAVALRVGVTMPADLTATTGGPATYTLAAGGHVIALATGDSRLTSAAAGATQVTFSPCPGVGPLAPGVYDLSAYLTLDEQAVGDSLPRPGALHLAAGPVALTVSGVRPETASLVPSPDGLGPLLLGVPMSANPGAPLLTLDPTYCQRVWTGDGQEGTYPYGDPAAWLTAEDRARFAVEVDPSTHVPSWIEVRDEQMRTAEGVHVGSAVGEVQAAYPDLRGPWAPSADAPSRAWWVVGGRGAMVFETAQAPGGEQVVAIHLLATGASVGGMPAADWPRFLNDGSDNVPNTCL